MIAIALVAILAIFGGLVAVFDFVTVASALLLYVGFVAISTIICFIIATLQDAAEQGGPHD